MTTFTQAEKQWAGLISGSSVQKMDTAYGIYARYVFIGHYGFYFWDKEFLLHEFVNHDVDVPMSEFTTLLPVLAFRLFSIYDLRWVTVGLPLIWPSTTVRSVRMISPVSNEMSFFPFVQKFFASKGPSVKLYGRTNLFDFCPFHLFLGSDLKKPGWNGRFPAEPQKYISEILGRLHKASNRYPRQGRPKPQQGWSTRNSNRPNPETVTGHLRHAVLGFTGDVPSSDYPFTALSRTYSSTRTPGFRSLKKRQLPDNPYSMEVKKVVQSQAIIVSKWNEVPFGPSGHIVYSGSDFVGSLPLPSAPVFDVTVKNRAQKKLADRAGLEISSIPQDIVQFRQMQKLIGSNFFNLANSYKALKRGDINSAVEHLLSNKPKRAQRGVVRTSSGSFLVEGRFIRTRNGKVLKVRDEQSIETLSSSTASIATKWLELQYGWKPALMDIHTLLQANANFVVNSEVEKRIRVSAENDKILEDEIASYGDSTVAVDTSVKNVKTVLSTYSRCSIVLRYKLADRLKSFLSQTGFTSPVSLAYEILPWSFVLDWALPIGPYLQSFSDFEGMEFKGGSSTNFVRQTYHASINAHYSRPNFSNYVDLRLDTSGSYTREWVKMDRVRLTSFPTQVFPALKNPLSVEHALNGLALLRTVFGRKTGN